MMTSNHAPPFTALTRHLYPFEPVYQVFVSGAVESGVEAIPSAVHYQLGVSSFTSTEAVPEPRSNSDCSHVAVPFLTDTLHLA